MKTAPISSHIWILDLQLVVLFWEGLGDLTLLENITGDRLWCFKFMTFLVHSLCFMIQFKMWALSFCSGQQSLCLWRTLIPLKPNKLFYKLPWSWYFRTATEKSYLSAWLAQVITYIPLLTWTIIFGDPNKHYSLSSLITLKISSYAGEMAQWVKYLPHKSKDLDLGT